MNIDKDIEKLKALKYISISGHFQGQFMRAELPEEDKQAIENVLSELETKKLRIDNLKEENELQHCDLQNAYSINNGLKKELETYKKMVNLLEDWLVGEMCKEANKKGGILNTNKVKKEIDKLAREEVEKDER